VREQRGAWWRAGTGGEDKNKQKSLLISVLADEMGKYASKGLYDG